jgi:general secretion pathway protein G
MVKSCQAMRCRLGAFTLIELLVALAIVALLLSIVTPRYFGSVSRAEEVVLQEDLRAMRDALDKHYGDLGRYPVTLEELVSKRYLRNIPSDPLTQRTDTWVLVPRADLKDGGIFDVKSGAIGTGKNGKPYGEW